jgi:hypothetical protein
MRSTRISLARTAATRTSLWRWLTRALLLVLAVAAVVAPAEATVETADETSGATNQKEER